jgi:hypothetical protein
METEADSGPQAGLALFLLHTKYLRPDKGFPDIALRSAKVVSPELKRMIESRPFPGALKRSFPRINAGAPTTGKFHSLKGTAFRPYITADKPVRL